LRQRYKTLTEKIEKLLDQVREELRLRRYALRTEKAYTDWIKRYVKFHKMRGRQDLEEGTAKVSAFLTHLASDRNVAAAAQNQALAALLFLYKSGIGDRTALARPDRALQAPEARAGRADPC